MEEQITTPSSVRQFFSRQMQRKGRKIIRRKNTSQPSMPIMFNGSNRVPKQKKIKKGQILFIFKLENFFFDN